MDGFKRPARPQAGRPLAVPPRAQAPASRPRPLAAPPATPAPAVKASKPKVPATKSLDLSLSNEGKAVQPRFATRKRRILFILGGMVAVLLLILVGIFLWYNAQLAPVNSADTHVERVEVKEGTAFTYIASRLKQRGLIRSTVAFDVYARLSGKRSAVQAGTCSLTPADSASEILDKLTSGCHDFKSVTFYPGATLTDAPYSKTISVRSALAKAGYSEADIDSALAAQYDSPLFAGRPDGATLEGYVYGDTFYLDPAAPANHAIQKSLDEMWSKLQATNDLAAYSAQGLSLYQAITIASIVQSELGCWNKTDAMVEQCKQDQKQIAQVFLKRYKEGGTLGSDMTAYYGAHLAGHESDVKFDSPYNTRIHPGLPPGPISAPGIDALDAVANPSKTSYGYFLAGDDGVMYYANTLQEHEANIKNHCKQQCSIK